MSREEYQAEISGERELAEFAANVNELLAVAEAHEARLDKLLAREKRRRERRDERRLMRKAHSFTSIAGYRPLLIRIDDDSGQIIDLSK